MRQLCVLVFGILVGCDVVLPSSVTGPVVSGVSQDGILNASVVVLTREGYTVDVADRAGGFVTTDWRAESSFASQAILGVSHQKRVSVIFDVATGEISVQMTRQKKEYDGEWRTDGLSDNDRREMDRILTGIQERIRLLREQTDEFGS